MGRTLLIAANWKMEKTIAEAEAFATKLKSHLGGVSGCDLLICPPFFAVTPTARVLEGTAVAVGAQDLYFEKGGAFTGEVSTTMIADAGASFVLVGHSERRHVIGEANDIIARKLHAALDGGLTPVFCVGEKIEEREAGRHEAYVETQMATAYDGLDRDAASKVIVAYEPVWAIGTGKTASPEDAEAMHAFIRAWLTSHYDAGLAEQTRILYGGSVKPDNAAALLGQENIDGALIGGASLKVDSYVAIAQAAS